MKDKNDLLVKANLKEKEAVPKQDEDSDDYGSVEGDMPHVKLEELLSNMRIACDDDDDSYGEEESKKQ